MTLIKAMVKDQYVSTNEMLTQIVEDIILAKIFVKQGRLPLQSLRELEDKFHDGISNFIDVDGVCILGVGNPTEDGVVPSVITVLDLKQEGKSYWVESFDIEDGVFFLSELVEANDEN